MLSGEGELKRTQYNLSPHRYKDVLPHFLRLVCDASLGLTDVYMQE